MSTKQYLKMADVFPFAVQFDSDGGIGAVVDSQGEYIAQAMENNYCSHMTNKDKNGYRNKIAKYISHSVASHDELVDENERLRNALECTTNHSPDTAEMVQDRCAVLMTLDEAIDHANEKSIGSSQCAAQHAQLAKWLTDYRAMLAAAPKHEGGAS